MAADSIRRCLGEAERTSAGQDAWSAVDRYVRFTAREMSGHAGIRDALGTVVPDGRPVEDVELRGRLASLVQRAQDEGSLRRDVADADMQAAMCGLSAAIRAGAGPDTMAGILLAGLRAGEQRSERR